MPTVGPSPTPTPGCDYCRAARNVIEGDRQVINKAMNKIRKQAQQLKAVRELVRAWEADVANSAGSQPLINTITSRHVTELRKVLDN